MPQKTYIILFSLALLTSLSDASASPKLFHSLINDTIKDSAIHEPVQFGIASYYADKFEGRKTANGDIFNQQKFTAAHNRLPLGTYVIVTNLRNNRSVKVKINDRLHRRNKRLVDLSKAAAKKIGFIKMGITRVKIEVIH
jgi:rare lipoprotein A (peptidoglycan hydrolase)